MIKNIVPLENICFSIKIVKISRDVIPADMTKNFFSTIFSLRIIFAKIIKKNGCNKTIKVEHVIVDLDSPYPHITVDKHIKNPLELSRNILGLYIDFLLKKIMGRITMVAKRCFIKKIWFTRKPNNISFFVITSVSTAVKHPEISQSMACVLFIFFITFNCAYDLFVYRKHAQNALRGMILRF